MTNNEIKDTMHNNENKDWTYSHVNGETQYAGIITALRPEASEGYEMYKQYKDLAFSPEDEGKFVIIDRKLIDEKRDPELYQSGYQLNRFMAVRIENGRVQWEQGASYLQTWLELTQKADSLQEMYKEKGLIAAEQEDEITLTAEDLNFDNSSKGPEL